MGFSFHKFSERVALKTRDDSGARSATRKR